MQHENWRLKEMFARNPRTSRRKLKEAEIRFSPASAEISRLWTELMNARSKKAA